MPSLHPTTRHSPVRSLVAALCWGALSGCTQTVPEACEAWCDAALPITDACLAEDGFAFEDEAWGSAEGWRESCSTWAWTSIRLEADARRRGEVEGRGHTERVCQDWLDRAPGLDCETLDTFDWDAVPGTSTP